MPPLFLTPTCGQRRLLTSLDTDSLILFFIFIFVFIVIIVLLLLCLCSILLLSFSPLASSCWMKKSFSLSSPLTEEQNFASQVFSSRWPSAKIKNWNNEKMDCRPYKSVCIGSRLSAAQSQWWTVVVQLQFLLLVTPCWNSSSSISACVHLTYEL